MLKFYFPSVQGELFRAAPAQLVLRMLDRIHLQVLYPAGGSRRPVVRELLVLAAYTIGLNRFHVFHAQIRLLMYINAINY